MLRSSLFLALCSALGWRGVCLSLNAAGRTTSAALAAGAAAAGLAVLVEKKSRRIELALYCLSRVGGEADREGAKGMEPGGERERDCRCNRRLVTDGSVATGRRAGVPRLRAMGGPMLCMLETCPPVPSDTLHPSPPPPPHTHPTPPTPPHPHPTHTTTTTPSGGRVVCADAGRVGLGAPQLAAPPRRRAALLRRRRLHPALLLGPLRGGAR